MHRSSGRSFLPPPGSGSKYPAYILAQSAVGVSGAADTNENTLATITVPANAIGPNGTIRVWTTWTFNSGADDKITRVRFSGASGAIYLSAANVSSVTARYLVEISNVNAANSQKSGSGAGGSFATSAAAIVTSSVDTTAATTIVITGQKETAGDTLTLERYLVEVLYGA